MSSSLMKICSGLSFASSMCVAEAGGLCHGARAACSTAVYYRVCPSRFVSVQFLFFVAQARYFPFVPPGKPAQPHSVVRPSHHNASLPPSMSHHHHRHHRHHRPGVWPLEVFVVILVGLGRRSRLRPGGQPHTKHSASCITTTLSTICDTAAAFSSLWPALACAGSHC